MGAWQNATAAVSAGRAYLYSGRNGKLIRTYTCRTPGDTFGFDAVGMGDVNGDGLVDLLITSAWSGVNGHHSGRVFAISSRATGKWPDDLTGRSPGAVVDAGTGSRKWDGPLSLADAL